MGFLDKIKNMFNKVDATVNTPPPNSQPNEDAQAANDALNKEPPASQDPAAIGTTSSAPTPQAGQPAAPAADPSAPGQVTPPKV